jgi:AraC-like DNA-binding protein
MIDLAHIPLATLELGLRGAAIGAFAATGMALAASRRLTPARWTGVALFACAIAHVIDSAYQSLHPGLLLWVMSVTAPGALWLFCSVLFEDEPVIPPWRYAIPGACVVIGLLGATLPYSPLRLLVWQAFAAFSVGIVAHVLLIAWRGWRSDLVDQRRRLRAPLAAAAAGYTLVESFCNFGFREGQPLPHLVQAIVLAALALGGALALLRVEPLLVQAATAAGEAPLPAAAPSWTSPPPTAWSWPAWTRPWTRRGLARRGPVDRRPGRPGRRARTSPAQADQRHAGPPQLRRLRQRPAHRGGQVALADPEQALKSVSTIAYELGFASLGPFNRAFRAATGVTPTAWRQPTRPHPYLRLVETGEGPPKADKRA